MSILDTAPVSKSINIIIVISDESNTHVHNNDNGYSLYQLYLSESVTYPTDTL